jgi:hypothetical protein
LGDLVDPVERSRGPIRSKSEGLEVGSPFDCWIEIDSPFVVCGPVAVGGVVGVGLSTCPAEPFSDLSGRHPTGKGHDPFQHQPGGLIVEMGGALDDGPCHPHIDPTGRQRLRNLGETLLQLDRHPQVVLGCGPGQPQGG